MLASWGHANNRVDGLQTLCSVNGSFGCKRKNKKTRERRKVGIADSLWWVWDSETPSICWESNEARPISVGTVANATVSESSELRKAQGSNERTADGNVGGEQRTLGEDTPEVAVLQANKRASASLNELGEPITRGAGHTVNRPEMVW
jgi:hypothetical protein